jgi:hypothetical protein
MANRIHPAAPQDLSHDQPKVTHLGAIVANHNEMCEAGLDMMTPFSLLLRSPLVGFFFTERVIHAMVVVAYLLFVSIGCLFLATVIVRRYRASAMKDRR